MPQARCLAALRPAGSLGWLSPFNRLSSRKIERLTHDSVAVRYLCADTHPDHDSICKFRRENDALLKTSFHQVLELAAQAKVLKVGDIVLAVDGTKILANASKHRAVSHGHACEQMKLLAEEVDALLSKAEQADSTPLADGLSVPEEVKRRSDRIEKLKAAVKVIEERAKERFKAELSVHAAKVAQRSAKAAATGKKAPGRPPEPPKEEPRASDQFNFTDAESRIMKAAAASTTSRPTTPRPGWKSRAASSSSQKPSPTPPTTSKNSCPRSSNSASWGGERQPSARGQRLLQRLRRA